MRHSIRKRQDDRVEELWTELGEEISKDKNGAAFTHEQLSEVAEALDRYTLAMPTASDTERLLERMALAECFGKREVSQRRTGLDGFLEEDGEYSCEPEGAWLRFKSITRVVRSQTRLFDWPFWLVSAFLILLGGWLGFYAEGRPGINPLVMIVPLLAALSVCAAFRTFGTPMFELEMTMPVTPAQLVYGRLCLILGVDMVLALAVSPMAASGKQDLGGLIADWLLPLAVTSMAALAAVLYVRPFPAAGISLAIWAALLLLNHNQVSSGALDGSRVIVSDGMVRILAAAALAVSFALIHHRIAKLSRSEGGWL
jgi:hypothetical protein